MCFTFLDNIIHALKYLQRIFLNILFLYDAIEKTGTVSGVTGSPYLGDFCQNRIKVAVSRQGFHILEMPGCQAFGPVHHGFCSSKSFSRD